MPFLWIYLYVLESRSSELRHIGKKEKRSAQTSVFSLSIPTKYSLVFLLCFLTSNCFPGWIHAADIYTQLSSYCFPLCFYCWCCPCLTPYIHFAFLLPMFVLSFIFLIRTDFPLLALTFTASWRLLKSQGGFFLDLIDSFLHSEIYQIVIL